MVGRRNSTVNDPQCHHGGRLTNRVPLSPKMSDLRSRVPRPKIGLLPIGHFSYWDQFPDLRDMGFRKAGRFFRDREIDILVIFPLGYTTSMCVMPALRSSLSTPPRRSSPERFRLSEIQTAESGLRNPFVSSLGDRSREIDAFAEAMEFRITRIWAGSTGYP